ncbi:MAG: hypothetical protein ACPG19_04665 [Saprospiraceae bacterium]
MTLKKTLLIFPCLFIFLINASAQKLGIKDIKNLRVTHQINQIYALEMIKKDGLLIGDTRLEGGDLDGLLVRFNLKGRVLKEVRLGRTDSYERIIKLEKTKKGYYLLMNSVKKDKTRRLLFYELDNALSILSSEVISIPNISTEMVYDSKRNVLMIVTTIFDKKNSFPQLITYDLTTKKIIKTLNFNQVNRPEKGKKRPTFKWTKACTSIRFSDESYNELLLTGSESSTNISDCWIAKVVDNQIIWEDRFATTVGRDEGISTFKTPAGYLSFGHEYSQKTGINFSYRTLLLSEKGQEKSAERYYRRQKDKFKDVVRLGKKHFVMFGHSQEMMLLDAKPKASNLWAIMVNEKGEFIVDYEHQTEMIDEAYAITRMDNGDMPILFERDGDLMIGILELLVP